MGKTLSTAKARFTRPTIYAPVFGVTGKCPFVSTYKALRNEVDKMSTGVLAVS